MYYTEHELKEILDRYDDLLKKSHKSLYRTYTVNKKSGDNQRRICEPCSELKALQQKLLPLIMRHKVSPFCAAYENGCSIKKNAEYHIKGKHILHTDIKEFFPSITSAMFYKVFCEGIGYRTAEKFWFAVSYRDGLPIGASTSPFIANRIMYDADIKLSKLKFFVKFTRYADDLVFSARRPFKKNFIDKVDNVLKNSGLWLNLRKTYFMSSRKEVTGIIITDRKLSTGTSFKKRLKSDIYTFLTKGTGYPDIIMGRLSHLKHIEPGYAETIRKKYAKLDKKGVFWPAKRHKKSTQSAYLQKLSDTIKAAVK